MINKSVLLGAGLFSLICSPAFSQANTVSGSQATTPTNQSQSGSNNNPAATAPIIVHGAAPAASQLPTGTPAANTPVTPTALTPATPTNPVAATAAAAAAAAAKATPASVESNPAAGTSSSAPTNNATIPSSSSDQTGTSTPQSIDCNYHIPPTTSGLDTGLVLQWGQKAAQQTFTFTPSILDAQLDLLKACYTEQGWQSFNDALLKSGNLDAIKKENLTVSSMLDGQATISSIKDNQWKVIVPIQVVYQNGKEKIVQSLTINLAISRKVSGDLGIIQVVAMPRQSSTNPAPTTEVNPANTGAATTTAPGGALGATITPPASTTPINTSTKP